MQGQRSCRRVSAEHVIGGLRLGGNRGNRLESVYPEGGYFYPRSWYGHRSVISETLSISQTGGVIFKSWMAPHRYDMRVTETPHSGRKRLEQSYVPVPCLSASIPVSRIAAYLGMPLVCTHVYVPTDV